MSLVFCPISIIDLYPILRHAYNLVRSKKGAPGIDGVSFEAIEAGEGVELTSASWKNAHVSA
jgi:hypothetical protein